MKVLITGGSSLLGRALINLASKDYNIEATWYTNHVGFPMSQLDICNKSQIGYIFSKVKPEIVIHCAANGSVDFAEKNYMEAAQVNVHGTEYILQAAKDFRAKVVYISTNAVYGGKKPPYAESDNLYPINAYGAIKKRAEEAVRFYQHDWLIIRPFMFYGWPWSGGRPNWATLVIDKLGQGQGLKLVNDVIWQPTYVEDVAKAIWHLIGAEVSNAIYNVAGSERATLYEFGLKVAKVFELDEGLIEPVDSSFFSGMAPRPKDTGFDLSRLEATGFEADDIEAGLERMKRCQLR